jgi:septal ring-binding cell division protein DamX
MARNTRIRPSKLELHPPRRSVGGLVAACVLAAAAVFALGLALGRGEDASSPAATPSDPLTALDEAERIAPPAPPPARLVFHDALTDDRPAETLPPPTPRPAIAPSPAARPMAQPAPAPAATEPAPAPSPAPATAPTLAAAPEAPRADAPAAAPPRPLPGPGWAIQLGASPKESEAQRLAARHDGARVVAADVDGKRWYRVRVGGFASRAEAQAALDRLARERSARGFVTASR